MHATLLLLLLNAPFTPEQIIVVEPGRRVGPAAFEGRAPWCTAPFEGEAWDTARVAAAMKEIEQSQRSSPLWGQTLAQLCQFPDDPTWQKQALACLQISLNDDQNSQERAVLRITEAIALMKGKQADAKAKRDAEAATAADPATYAFSASELEEKVEPFDGIDTAKLAERASWCSAVSSIDDQWTPHRLARTFTSSGVVSLIQSAVHICQRPTDPTWKIYSAKILQQWMNWTRLNQADAEKSLAFRVQTKTFEDQRKQLCNALEVGPEVAGQERTYGEARLKMFGCLRESRLIWQDASNLNAGGVGYYLDADSQVDELMRVYWLYGTLRDPPETELPAKDAFYNGPLLQYALSKADVAKIDKAAIDKLLSGEPWNEYARIATLENLAMLQWRARYYEKAVAKLTKGDADYKAILVDAPKAALAQWDKVLTQWGPELERSNAYEKLFSLPSGKALKGCAPAMTKDIEKLLKSYKLKDFNALIGKVKADPAASVLMRRASWCYAIDEVQGASGVLKDLVQDGRDLRGPRSLVYFAMVDAIAEARKDRPRLLLDFNGFFSPLEGKTNFAADFKFTGSLRNDLERAEPRGVVASVTKGKSGVEIKFKHSSYTYPEELCRDDKAHPLKIDSGGNVHYYQLCVYTGKTLTENTTPSPITVSPHMASGVKPGLFVQADNYTSVVPFTRASPKDKTITSFYGFDL